jgi:hypothetical protein
MPLTRLDSPAGLLCAEAEGLLVMVAVKSPAVGAFVRFVTVVTVGIVTPVCVAWSNTAPDDKLI